MILINGVASVSDFTIGKMTGTVDQITSDSEGVAASLNTLITSVATDGDADLNDVTLANGADGQIKFIYCSSTGNAGGTLKITPATFVGGANVLLDGTPPESCGVLFAYSEPVGWVLMASTGHVIP